HTPRLRRRGRARATPINPEGGLAPLPTPPPGRLHRRSRRSEPHTNRSSPISRDWRVLRRSTRRGAVPPFRTSPQADCTGEAGARSGAPTAHRRSRGTGACYADQLGGGLRPPSEPPPRQIAPAKPALGAAHQRLIADLEGLARATPMDASLARAGAERVL